MEYIIGTRGSKLAVAQAEHVRTKLSQAYPEHKFEIRTIRTTGDRILDRPLHELGSKGIFVKEIEEDILNRFCVMWEDMRAFLSCIDVIVDGEFVLEQKDISLQFRGSANQRIILVQESLARGETVLWQGIR